MKMFAPTSRFFWCAEALFTLKNYENPIKILFYKFQSMWAFYFSKL